MTALNFLETCQRLNKPGRVAIVEAGKEGERCGASRWTGAFLRLGHDLAFDEDWVQEMIQVSNGQADVEYCRKLAREAKTTAEYVKKHGVNFVRHEEKNVLLEFKTNQYFVMPDGGGWAIIQALMKHIESFDNCAIHWETEARSLLTDHQGRINGVQVRRSNGLLDNLYAPDVMLASGGFEGNREMLAKYVGPKTHELQLIAPGLKYNRGQGLKMALDVGAETAGSFDGIHSELVDTRATKPDAVIWGHNYGIVINDGCERFYDEGNRHLFATFEMIALELWRHHHNKGFFITDATTMDRFRPGWVYQTTDQDPIQASSIAELAGKLGVEQAKLQKTWTKASYWQIAEYYIYVNRQITRCLHPTPMSYPIVQLGPLPSPSPAREDQSQSPLVLYVPSQLAVTALPLALKEHLHTTVAPMQPASQPGPIDPPVYFHRVHTHTPSATQRDADYL